MKKTTLISKTIFTAMALLFMALANVQTTSAQNISFNGYWEAPNGWILLVKERIYLFVNPDGSLMGGTGRFAQTNATQFILQQLNDDSTNTTYTFNYTVIDSGSIRVTPVGGNEWANGTWRKRNNIRGTAVNHRIIGYWEGKIGDTTRILYFAGRDIVPSSDLRRFYGSNYNGQSTQPDGYFFNFDKDGNFTDSWIMYFDADSNTVQFMFDTAPQAFRFDGADLIVSPFTWKTNEPEIRFVRK